MADEAAAFWRAVAGAGPGEDKGMGGGPMGCDCRRDDDDEAGLEGVA